MTIHLGRLLPGASRDRPGRPARKPACPARARSRRPYLVLLPVGFAVPPPSPAPRCALTAPFHPRPQTGPCGPVPAGRLLSVALSLGSPPPGVTRHRVSVEPGLSSPGSPRERPSGRLIHPLMSDRPARAASFEGEGAPPDRPAFGWRANGPGAPGTTAVSGVASAGRRLRATPKAQSAGSGRAVTRCRGCTCRAAAPGRGSAGARARCRSPVAEPA